jgi:hypothetical protein
MTEEKTNPIPKECCASCDKEIQWPWYLCLDCLDVLLGKKENGYWAQQPWKITSIASEEENNEKVVVNINEYKFNNKTQN